MNTNAATATTKTPATSSPPKEPTSSPPPPSKWLLRQLESDPLPQKTSELLSDPRFSFRANGRKPNSLTLRAYWSIDCEALEWFMAKQDPRPWGVIDGNNKVASEHVTKEEAEAEAKKHGRRVVPLADFR